MSEPHQDGAPLWLPGRARAFGYAQDLEPLDTGWNEHDTHQLLYAAAGTLRLEVGGALWLLPPQRGAWIEAGTPHRVTSGRPTRLRTVYFDASVEGPDSPCCVFAMTPLGREMVLHAMRWPEEGASDRQAILFFEALAGLCREWGESPLDFRLQRPRSEELRRAMDYALERLGEDPRLEDAARHAGVSGRTLSRRFAEETRSTWRQFLHSARMLRAMELLSAPDQRVTDVALEVGFESLGAFSQAFRLFAGETPSDYRSRSR